MSREEVVEEIRNTVREMEENQIKLQDGYYKAIDCWFQYWAVSKGGDELLCKDSYDMYTYDESVEYGDFGKKMKSIILFILMYLLQERPMTRSLSWLERSADTT